MARRQRPEDPIPPVNEESEHQAFILYVSHPELTLSEISALVGEPEGTVRSWKCRRKWDRGLAEVRAMMEKRRTPTVESPVIHAAVRTRDEIAADYEGNFHYAADKFGKHVKTMDAAAIIEDAPKLDAADKMFGRRLKLDVDDQAGQSGHISLTFLTAGAAGSVRLLEPSQPKLLDTAAADG